jgi:2-oxoisovalerate dehydrogenase E1 component
MFNRAEIVDKNFIEFVSKGLLPQARSQTSLQASGLSPEEFMDLFETQLMSRQLDLRARILKNQNECYYTIGSSGHEGNAVWGKVFRLDDMAFVHYRSCAFMIQRAKQLKGSTPLYDTLLSYVASSEDPIAGGRHKVFGSYPLLVPPQTSTIASHLPKAMGAAFAIGRAKEMQLASKVMSEDSVVFCTFGDASVNHSTAVGAINSSLWVAYQNLNMPIVYICEDNGIGISVHTPKNWVETQYAHRPGLKYFSCDGLNLCDVYKTAQDAATYAREKKRPVFLHAHTIRLLGHAGSDMEQMYHSLEQIEKTEFQDPLLHSARIALENDLVTADEIIKLYKEIEARVAHIGEQVKTRPKYLSREEVRKSLTQCAYPKKIPELKTIETNTVAKFHFAKLQNMVLQETLQNYPASVIFGEDVAQKGGVYNVTEGLHKKFGAKRVFNSILDEQTILGTAIGFSQNGFLPIPEIQFLAYVHNAEDQIRGEAATMAFFSQGQFTNGMVIRIAGLPYQKGFGGHFHNDNSLAVFRDIPGVVLAVPSNGADSVKMFRACIEQAWRYGRVVVFVEPIALYMTRDLHAENDKLWTFNYPELSEKIAVGEFGTFGTGKDLAVVSYGNGYYYSRQATQILESTHQIKSTLFDIRWMSSVDQKSLAENLQQFSQILIVDECRKTGSWSEWMSSFILEHLTNQPKVAIVAADDCFIPLGKASAAGLPSRDEIIQAALSLCKGKKT